METHADLRRCSTFHIIKWQMKSWYGPHVVEELGYSGRRYGRMPTFPLDLDYFYWIGLL